MAHLYTSFISLGEDSDRSIYQSRWTNTKSGERYPRYNPVRAGGRKASVAAISIASSCMG